MFRNDSPLETLAAFGIAFVAGVVATVGLNLYVGYVKKSSLKED